MRWGLIPSWSQDASIAGKTFNARGETRSEKPVFRDALRKRRCLIPADGFYEWRKGDKTPFCFTMADDSIFASAGIWDSWRSPEGPNLETFSILDYHHQTQLVTRLCSRPNARHSAHGYNLWLDPGFQRMDALCDRLRPFDASWMRGYEVSSRVNSVKNDDPVCAERVETLFST